MLITFSWLLLVAVPFPQVTGTSVQDCPASPCYHAMMMAYAIADTWLQVCPLPGGQVQLVVMMTECVVAVLIAIHEL